MARATTLAVAAFLAAAFNGSAASAEGWSGSLAVTSDYIVRGITRSDGDPSLQGDLHRDFAQGWFAGLSAATVRLGPDEPISAEADAYAGYRQDLGGGFHGSLTATHYDYPGSDSGDQYRYDEVAAAIAWRNRLRLSASVLPDTSIESRYGKANGRPAYAADIAIHQPVRAGWSFNAGLGYYDLQQLIGVGYPYWNGGIAYDCGSAQIDLSYIGSSATAKSLYYDERAGNRWAATLVWQFF